MWRTMNKILYFFLPILVLMLVAWSTSSASTNPNAMSTLEPVPAEYADKTNPLSTDAATAGALVFDTNCSICHGPQGHGDGPAGVSLDPAPKNLVELTKI